MILGDHVKPSSTIPRWCAYHLKQGLKGASLGYRAQEPCAAEFACIVGQTHACILVAIGQDFITYKAQIGCVQFLSSKLKSVAYASIYTS